MKKNLVLIGAMVLAFGACNIASAATLVDVPTNNWAYGAVKQLAADGIVEGYGDGKFYGDKSMTRYEFATIIARAIDKEDKVSAADKALIEKLATEYKNELTNLGVRVKALEDKNGQLQIDGDLRLRDDQQSNGSTYNDKHMNMDLKATFQINDNWAVKAESEWQRQFNDPAIGDTAGYNANNTSPGAINSQTEQLYVTGMIDGATLKLGKQDYNPVYGLSFDTQIQMGAATFGNVVKATLADGKTDGMAEFRAIDANWAMSKNTHIAAGYQKLIATSAPVDPSAKYSSLGFDTRVANDLVLTAAAGKSDATTYNKATLVKLQYKEADPSKVNSNDFFVSYKNIHSNAVYLDKSPNGVNTEDRVLDINFKGVRVGYEFVPEKNVKVAAWYMTGKDADTSTIDKNVYRGQVEFFF